MKGNLRNLSITVQECKILKEHLVQIETLKSKKDWLRILLILILAKTVIIVHLFREWREIL